MNEKKKNPRRGNTKKGRRPMRPMPGDVVVIDLGALGGPEVQEALDAFLLWMLAGSSRGQPRAVDPKEVN